AKEAQRESRTANAFDETDECLTPLTEKKNTMRLANMVGLITGGTGGMGSASAGGSALSRIWGTNVRATCSS
ncbi:MAG TPA: hypothetical protein VGM50_04940, partial [Gemmatimonadaceae bacterium]